MITGIAGVYFVAAKLSWLGIIAVPTMRNTRGIDLLVSSGDGKRLATVQVKTQRQKLNFWLCKPLDRGRPENLFYAFVRPVKRGSADLEAFIFPAAKVKVRTSKNGKFTFFRLPSRRREEHLNRWDLIVSRTAQ